MKRILIAIAVLLGVPSFANTDPIHIGDQLYVIAPSGINVRSNPSTQYGILFGVGFGEKVTVVERDLNHQDYIDQMDGHWVMVSYGNQSGYVFDGFLSKLPPTTFDEISDLGDCIDRMKQYALQTIGSVGAKVTYNNLVDGEGAFKIDIHTLKGGAQYVEYSYHEGLDSELQLVNVRSQEVGHLLKALFKKEPAFDEQEIHTLETGKNIQFSTEEGIYVTIRKSNDRYSIFLEVASCC